ncbi:MAG TPA: YgiT-type zinc finger protein [Nitrospiria bacterium]|jgi:YgiT-type zinc finger domain-containing protein
MKKNKHCPNCKTIMELKQTTVHFERGGFYADVENVSSYICPNCGTRSIPGPIAEKISATVDELFKRAKELQSAIPGEFPAFTGISFHKIAS